MGHRPVDLEVAMRAAALGIHGALWDTFLAKMGKFFAKHEVFNQRGTADTCLQRIVIFRTLHTLVACQNHCRPLGNLFELGLLYICRCDGAGGVCGFAPGLRHLNSLFDPCEKSQKQSYAQTIGEDSTRDTNFTGNHARLWSAEAANRCQAFPP